MKLFIMHFFSPSPLTSSLLGPNFFVYICSRNASTYIIYLIEKTKFQAHVKNRQYYINGYFNFYIFG